MKKIIRLGLVIIWCIVIFLFSNENSSTSNSRSKQFISYSVSVYEKARSQPVDQKDQVVNSWNFIVRKFAHFSLYFILGILVIWCLDHFVEGFSRRIVLTLLFCLCYAVFDEVHQLFVGGRAGRLFDVAIDFLGALTAVFLFSLFVKWKQFRLEQK